jgi:hypothetical protein
MIGGASLRVLRSAFGRFGSISAVVAILSAAAPGTRADELTFVLRIENGRVPADMRLIRVKQGDAVKLRISADRRTILHLHGYDIEKTVDPGAVTELTFTARATGRFTIEPHIGNQAGGHSHGEALVTIEVFPR